jgi:hypothetical protein
MSKVKTTEGMDLVDSIGPAVEGIEESVRADIEDAVRALVRYGPDLTASGTDVQMVLERDGDYLDRSEVLQAIVRWNR